MPVLKSSYISPLFLPNGHLQTIYPALFRRTTPVPCHRERVTTADDDFLDLDWTIPVIGSDSLVIISHGLEGSSTSPYILGMKRHLYSLGVNSLAWNMRGCSGEVNKCLRFYHSGETGDLDFVIKYSLDKGKYKRIFLIGFSLGGNITLKYLGEKGNNIPHQLAAAVAISVPCHLASCAQNLARWQNSIYLKRFLKSLRNKIKLKAPYFPSDLDFRNIDRIKNFLEFDNRYTAPLHGFKDANEYWEKNSSSYFLHNITIPTLLLNAANDPFLSKQCFPYAQAEENSNLFLETPDEGGHCGFYKRGNSYYSEKRAGEFIRNVERLSESEILQN